MSFFITKNPPNVLFHLCWALHKDIVSYLETGEAFKLFQNFGKDLLSADV